MNTRRQRRRRWPAMIALIALGALIFGAIPAAAAERRSGDTVVIATGDVIPDDLYVAGATVTIDGTVKGDVLATGTTVTINGTVEGDLFAIAQTVTINGSVRDDARIAAAAIVFGPQARLGDDFIGAAAQINQTAGATIEGDADVFASQALLAGAVGGDVSANAQGVEIRGTIGGTVHAMVGGAGDPQPQYYFNGLTALAVPSGLTIADGAKIEGAVTYESSTAAAVGANAQIAQAPVWTPTPGTPAASTTDLVLAQLRRFAVLLVIGLALVYGVPRWIGGLSETATARPAASLGWGLIGVAAAIGLLILVPALMILLMVFFGWLGLGGPLGITLIAGMTALGALIAGYAITASYLVQVVVGYGLGRWLIARIQPRWAEQRAVPLIAGLVLYALLRMIPGVGVIIALLVTLVGVGAGWIRGRAWLARRRAGGTPAPRLTPALQA